MRPSTFRNCLQNIKLNKTKRRPLASSCQSSKNMTEFWTFGIVVITIIEFINKKTFAMILLLSMGKDQTQLSVQEKLDKWLFVLVLMGFFACQSATNTAALTSTNAWSVWWGSRVVKREFSRMCQTWETANQTNEAKLQCISIHSV